LQNTTKDFKLTNDPLDDYTWIPSLNIAYRFIDENNAMKEIIQMLKINNYKADISIELSNGEIIYFNFTQFQPSLIE